MRRQLVVQLPVLADCHRQRIEAAAARQSFTVSFFEKEAAAADAVAEAEILLSASPRLADRAPLLRWQCTPSAGVDQFASVQPFLSGRAALTNSSGAYGVTIAEHVIMVTLEMLRRQPEYNSFISRQEWRRDLPIRSILGSRVTLLGTGDIGRQAALRLRGFLPQSLIGVSRSGKSPAGCFDRVVPAAQLDALLPETDILIISLPGTEEARHMLDARRLSLLPEGALIVNVGRGSVIDQQSLEKELRAGRLLAALDVFEQEPIPAEDPLWRCPNLLITSHVAGNMTLPYTVERIVSLFLEDFENYCAGRPLARQVDLRIGY